MTTDDNSEIYIDESTDEEILIPHKGARISTASGDPEIESLYNKQKRGKLILQPDFQRQYVWDSIKASKLIESALLSIPLPMIYLSEEKDGKEYVIESSA